MDNQGVLHTVSRDLPSSGFFYIFYYSARDAEFSNWFSAVFDTLLSRTALVATLRSSEHFLTQRDLDKDTGPLLITCLYYKKRNVLTPLNYVGSVPRTAGSDELRNIVYSVNYLSLLQKAKCFDSIELGSVPRTAGSCWETSDELRNIVYSIKHSAQSNIWLSWKYSRWRDLVIKDTGNRNSRDTVLFYI